MAEPAGIYSVGDSTGKAGWWTPGRKAGVILGSAAVAGTATGVALANASD